MQTSYNTNQSAGFAGMKADIGFDYVESMIAEEQIGFGLALVRVIGEAKRCRLPNSNVCTILDDAGDYTSGEVVVVINGQTLTIAWTTDKDTSMAAVATALQALSIVTTAVYSSGNHTIIITAADNIHLNVVPDVSGAVGGMTITSTLYTCTETIHSISLASHHMEQVFGNVINDQATITFAGDAMTTSDTIIVTMNGVTLGTVTYSGSEAATLQVLCNLILAEPGVLTCTVTGRVITIVNNEGQPLTINSVAISDDTVASVELNATTVHSSQNTRNVGAVYYKSAETVNALRRGRVYVTVEDAVTAGDPVYFRHSTSGTDLRGQFTNVVDSSTCTLWSAANYATDAAAGAVAQVEINLP